VKWYLAPLKNYAGFSGRSRRKEYWMFALCNTVIATLLTIIDLAIKTNLLSTIYVLAVIIPSLALVFRRLHDTGRSAWWILIGLIPIVGVVVMFVFMASNGQRGDNPYGPDPKMVTV
jgi:uncharacterized membrane protein YhaH (DUF805 family)